MSGDNLPLELPPGIFRDTSQYAAGMRWYDGNMVRWNEENVMTPIGGWAKYFTIAATEKIRAMFSWRDNEMISYMAMGTADKAFARIISTSVNYDITPAGLIWTPSEMEGYSAGVYGSGSYSLDSSGSGASSKFAKAIWSFDNWGQNLVGVHSIDGRLFEWDVMTPSTPMALITEAPIDNYMVITTNERHVMVLGGFGNPRKVKWCSRENIHLWAAASTNSAGGFDLDTNGVILAAVKVPQGIIVCTDIDVHLIEYVGPPSYYARRLVSSITGIVGPKAITTTPNGAIFVGPNNFWEFNAGLAPLPCAVGYDVFKRGNLTDPVACFMGTNEYSREVWFFFPDTESIEATRYACYRFDGPGWWSKGILPRTAFLNPIWQDEPLMAHDQDVFTHEVGWLADGLTRNGLIYAETGAIEISNGNRRAFVDRIYQDTVNPARADVLQRAVNPVPYSLTFKLRDAPQGKEWNYVPVTLNGDIGYTGVRIHAREMQMRVNQVSDQSWGLGRVRLRAKARGSR